MTTKMLSISILRIISTCLIFFHHYITIYTNKSTYAAGIGMICFVFIAGYLAKIEHPQDGFVWLKKRIKVIYSPYILVMASVIIICQVTNYKVLKIKEAILGLTGLEMFSKDPLYDIAWFITLIMFLYLISFLVSFLEKKNKLIYWILIIAAISLRKLKIGSPVINYYLPVYLFGTIVRESNFKDRNYFSVLIASVLLSFKYYGYITLSVIVISWFFIKGISISKKVDAFFGDISGYCYEFFLVHGIILLMVNSLFHLNYGLISFSFSFMLSVFAGIILNKSAGMLVNGIGTLFSSRN